MKIENSYQGKKAKRKLFVVLLLFLLFCMAGFGVYALITFDSNTNPNLSAGASSRGESKKLDDNGKAVDGMEKPKTPEQVLDELKKSQINVTDNLSSYILFPNGKAGTVGSWIVQNLKTNNVIMQCEVFLNNKLIAESVPIYPNQHIETIPLLVDVKAGTYDVTAYINYYKLDSNEYISKAGFKIKLTIQ